MAADHRGIVSGADLEEGRSAQLPVEPAECSDISRDEPAPSSAWEPVSREWDEEPGTELGRTTGFGEAPCVVPKADRVVLIRMDGAEAGRVYSIGEQACRIGRLPENDIVVDDGDVSRHHARIFRQADVHFVEDVGSRNGTYVQGRAVSRVVLRPGDLIQLGPRTGLKFDTIDARQEILLKQLYESSTRDGLTGAFNRKHFDDRISVEIAFARRHGTQVGLVMLDIDHFKRINDTYGHQAGDEVLRQLAARISDQLRAEDMFARIGGEEFAVVVRGTAACGCGQLAERLRSKIAASPMQVGGRSVQVTISLGSVARSGRAASVEGLLRAADECLYAAKRAGRNRAVVAE